MKDRIPSKIVNGAVRMEQVDENGNHVGYVYLKRADEPIVEGTPFSVQTILQDATATNLGLAVADNPTPNDAFAKTAELIEALRQRVAQVESSVPFPATVFTQSGTFTAAEEGYYRITAIGAGGTGGLSKGYKNDSYNYPGGGGGSGAICVCTERLSVGDTLSIDVNGYASVIGYFEAGKGSAGSDGKQSASTAVGGAGGKATKLSNKEGLFLFDGATGGSAEKRYYTNDLYNEEASAGRGGSVPYTLPGHAVNNGYSGVGFWSAFDFGYGGRGGYGQNSQYENYHKKPIEGGQAGVIIEYLGTAEIDIQTAGILDSLNSIVNLQEQYIGGDAQ